MASVSLSPAPYLTVLDVNGNPVAGAKITTYIAGTTTPQATYTDSTGTTPNANPIIADTAGRFVAYLTFGASYKFAITDSAGTAIRTQDNIPGTPPSAGVDVTGTAGEVLTAGQAVYLSDGSGGKTAGLWYKADSANAYSSTTNDVGMAVSAIASLASGTIRTAGSLAGLSSLTIGAPYYIGSAGAITATAPLNARVVGQADTVSSIILSGNPPVAPLAWVNDFRLTLTTALPITTADVTAATTLYCSPLTGNRIDLPNSAGAPSRLTSAEFSIAIPATTSQMYDVFCFNNAGVATLELLAWTNDTTRATAIVRTTNGRLLKSGDNTRLFLGCVRTTTVSGQTEDSFTKRYVWNYYNRVPRGLLKLYGDTNWAYTTATVRQANANAANQVEVVIGVAETPVSLTLVSQVLNNTGGMIVANGIGYDSTSAMLTGSGAAFTATAGFNHTLVGRADAHYPAVGRHFYAGLEWSGATGATTWYGTDGQGGAGPTGINSGLRGSIIG